MAGRVGKGKRFAQKKARATGGGRGRPKCRIMASVGQVSAGERRLTLSCDGCVTEELRHLARNQGVKRRRAAPARRSARPCGGIVGEVCRVRDFTHQCECGGGRWCVQARTLQANVLMFHRKQHSVDCLFEIVCILYSRQLDRTPMPSPKKAKWNPLQLRFLHF